MQYAVDVKVDVKGEKALTSCVTLAELNQMDSDAFSQALGAVFEHSPWVADAVYNHKPFQSVGDLHKAMVDTVRQSPRQARLDLLSAHPELAGKAASEGGLTQASSIEQASAGLLELDPDEAEEVARLNRYYRDKFGFPFIIAVRHKTKSKILNSWRMRLDNSPDTEFSAALEEVYGIARLRLDALIDSNGNTGIS